eukprot:CAMPEP_0117076922 /NCGR_PEP_ID=MMETSP0472-20121206/54217_1 /TAXON_ID=693140 ORGANISM="Tiarina fusus, Strain LIS" /NCGR_SAMPLE_ID=MMETSP0472 /ASSEMBLY_ACC=CAM_ASM_000603 /LENGTH=63 /DNA_ID=CAMNT_0004803005 /DNA_START=1 /DNA_END=189 /DNA_ORIENTATION=+
MKSSWGRRNSRDAFAQYYFEKYEPTEEEEDGKRDSPNLPETENQEQTQEDIQIFKKRLQQQEH